MKYILSIFPLVVYIFGVKSKKLLPNPWSQNLLLRFFLEFYSFRVYIYVLDLF